MNIKLILRKREAGLDALQSGRWKHQLPIALLLLASILVHLLFFMMSINDLEIINSEIKDNRISERFYWDNSQRAGVPNYNNEIAKTSWISRIFLGAWRSILNCRILFTFLGGLGIYLFLAIAGIRPLAALLGGVAYMFSPGWLSLARLGNLNEFRFIAYLPGVVLMLHYLRLRRSLLASGILSILLGLSFLENLPDYTIYLLFFLIVYFIYAVINFIIERKRKELTIFILLYFIAVAAAISWNIWFYKVNLQLSAYTLNNQFINFNGMYGVPGSISLIESLSLFIPGLFGNAGATYWGSMPYNICINYLGTIVVALALFGAASNKRNLSLFLAICLALFLLFSWGDNIRGWKFLPLFSSIQAPAVSLFFLPLFSVLLAAFGVESLLNIAGGKSRFILKIIVVVAILLLLFVAVTSLLNNNLFQTENELTNYSNSENGIPDNTLLTSRAQVFMEGGIRFFVALILLLGVFYLHARLPKAGNIVILVVLFFIMLDLGWSLFGDLIKVRIVSQEQNPPEQISSYLDQDDQHFRILPLGKEFDKPRWSNKYESLGGKATVQLARYEEVLHNCLKSEISDRLSLNWNIVDMLNVKYLIYHKKVSTGNLQYALYDLEEELILYENMNTIPRYWFVADYLVGENKKDIFRQLNNPDFDPRRLAILEEDIGKLEKGLASVREISYEAGDIELITVCDKKSLLILSELFCELGWNAYVDGELLEIIPANYILHGLPIPAGEHKIEIKYEITEMKYQNIFVLLGLGWAILSLLLGIFIYIRRNYRGKIIYSIRK